ncbi:hypothetical protein ACHAXA_002361 [Cyclostephanos tholiformis]|uniref:Mannose-P-dolichol utilization defect 1 protein homolog n=1 Tax=Cyclostephanos tholiformis TaxID=382380 RepID=A0ABD3SRZ3_9STRA
MTTTPTNNKMIDALVENAHIISLATWAWGGPSDHPSYSNPKEDVNPASCLESLPLLSSSCLSHLVAKLVGVGIILASCINKAPVIRNIVKSRSASGLSSTSIYGEIILYSNASFYNILRGNPFSAFGETFTVLLQTMIVVVLFWHYHDDYGDEDNSANGSMRRRWRMRGGVMDIAFALATYCAYLFVVFCVLTPSTHYVLMVYNPIVLVLTRGAQIIENHANKRTGAQSITTITMNLAGSLVRIGTTIKEIGFDFHILGSYGTSVLLNMILFVQIVMYRKNTELFLEKLSDKKKR